MRLLGSWAVLVWLGAAGAALAVPGVARAQLVVLTGGPSSATDSLAEALLIQFADSELQVRTRRLSRGDDAEGLARSLLTTHAARIVIWSRRVHDAQHDLRCVFRHADAVDSATTRLHGTWGPALERTIALKIRELLDGDRAQAPLDLAPATTNPRAAPAADTLRPPQPSTSVFSPLVEVGARGMTASGNGGAQAAFGLGAGGALTRVASRLELWLRVQSGTPLDAATMAGRVTAREWSPELSLHVLRRVDPSWLGGYLNLALRVVDAEGTNSSGERGERTRSVPALGAGAEARLGLTEALWARCALGAELALKSQRFAVDRQTVLELGTFRARAELSLVFSP